jgi:hypothetical protein
MSDSSPATPPDRGRGGKPGSPSRQTDEPSRTTIEIAPSRAFNPSAEEVLRWCIALSRSCRPYHRDWFCIHLRAVEGKLVYLLSGPSATLASLTQRVPAGLTLRAAPPVPTLALHESATANVLFPRVPRSVPTDPDPLGDFARVLAQVSAEEWAEVIINLSPSRGGVPASNRDASRGTDLSFGDMLATAVTAAPVQTSSAPRQHADSSHLPAGLAFRVCVHSHAYAPSRDRARELALTVLSPLHAWEPSQALRASSDGPVSRDGLAAHRPRRHCSRLVPQSTIAGLLLPPTASCSAPNVARTAASAPVPAGMPEVGPGVWPLGTPEGFSHAVGPPNAEVLFAVTTGQPMYGKSEAAKAQFVNATLPSGDQAEPPAGGAFADPHDDAARDLLAFYWQEPSRVLYMGLGDSWDGMWMPVYNPLDCRGKSPQEAERRVSAVVGGMSVAAGWDVKATRSLPIATKAVELLVAMAQGLGPTDPVPTVFQIPMVCMDLAARTKILRDDRIPPYLRRWWENEGASYKPDAFGPVTQIVSRIRSSVPLAAFMGGRSTFTPREAMDNRMVMLFGGLMSGDDQKDRLAMALFVRMLIQAAYSRGDVAREVRSQVCPPFYFMIDELPTCDGADLPKIFMELRKFMFRCQVMAVTPAALRSATWAAAITAASVVTTTSLTGQGANMLTSLGLWKDFDPRDLGEIEKYHFLSSFTLGGRKHPPIAVKGMQPQDIFEARPGVVESSFAANPRYRLVADIMEELETLDERLLAAWTGEKPGRGGTVSVAMPEDA